MIRPTRRAVYLTGASPLLALLAIAISSGLWPLPVAYLAAVLLAILLDGLRAMPGARLSVTLPPFEAAYVGVEDRVGVELATSWRDPPAVIEAKCEHDALIAMPDLLRADFGPQQAVHLDYPACRQAARPRGAGGAVA